jgi:uncharacterized alkaline shock family protein YloU
MERKLGTIIVSPAVLATVARLEALSVPGVTGMSPLGVHRLLGTRGSGGVRVQIVDEAVVLDVYILVAPDVDMLHLSREIQSKVTRAIHEMVGMAVREVNVHVVDVTEPQVPQD